jgi:hypothetical protein
MLRRCNNPNHPQYKDYGGRGIKICERWHDFQIFFADMGFRPDGLTLERKNNNGNYEPSNCCWATWKEQRTNTRPISCGPSKQCWFIGHSSNEKNSVLSNNQCAFAERYSLSQANISSCLHNKRKQTKGWDFSWL